MRILKEIFGKKSSFETLDALRNYSLTEIEMNYVRGGGDPPIDEPPPPIVIFPKP
jgi:hypothetical protein